MDSTTVDLLIATHLPTICLLITGVLVTAILTRENISFGIGKTGLTLAVSGTGLAITAASLTDIGSLILLAFIWILLAILAVCWWIVTWFSGY